MDWSAIDLPGVVGAISTAGWAFTAAAAFGVGCLYVYYRFGPKESKAEPSVDLSWDATREEIDRLRKENEMLRGSLGRWREFGARVLRHFTRCACLEQAVGRELLAECVQELMGETT